MYESKQKTIARAQMAIHVAIVVDQPRDSEIIAMPYMEIAAPM